MQEGQLFRTCNKCKKSKAISDFYTRLTKNKTKRLPLFSCKKCYNAADKRNRNLPGNREKRRAYEIAYEKENRIHINQKRQETYHEHKHEIHNIKKRLLKGAEKRARENGLEFNLTIEDIIVPDFCPVFESILICVNDSTTADGSPSLDRFDNTKGYVRGNVEVISHRANRLKSDATLDELIKIQQWIAHEILKRRAQ